MNQWAITEEKWQQLNDAAARILYPRVVYQDDQLRMLKEVVREQQRNAMLILDVIPRGAVPAPQPNAPAPQPIS